MLARLGFVAFANTGAVRLGIPSVVVMSAAILFSVWIVSLDSSIYYFASRNRTFERLMLIGDGEPRDVGRREDEVLYK